MVGAGKLGHGVHQPLPHLRKAEGFRAGERGDLVEVGSGGEEMGVAGDDQPRRRL